jgi:hypothetical protein
MLSARTPENNHKTSTRQHNTLNLVFFSITSSVLLLHLLLDWQPFCSSLVWFILCFARHDSFLAVTPTACGQILKLGG